MPMQEDLMGKTVRVEIVETGKHYMKGRLLNNHKAEQPDVPLPKKKGEITGVTFSSSAAEVRNCDLCLPVINFQRVYAL